MPKVIWIALNATILVENISPFSATLCVDRDGRFYLELWAEAKRKRLDTLTRRNIDAEIRAYRREQRKVARKTVA